MTPSLASNNNSWAIAKLVLFILMPGFGCLSKETSVGDYCRKMKGMVDALGNLGEVIQYHTLVLNILRDLNSKYDNMKALLQRPRPFLTFSEVRHDLLLEELTMDPSSSQSSTALLAA